MSGALIELVATGVQDAYLTGQPEVSFFRQKYISNAIFYENSSISVIKYYKYGYLC